MEEKVTDTGPVPTEFSKELMESASELQVELEGTGKCVAVGCTKIDNQDGLVVYLKRSLEWLPKRWNGFPVKEARLGGIKPAAKEDGSPQANKAVNS